jgi:multicomponent Na+:H+ antiporter subunit F
MTAVLVITLVLLSLAGLLTVVRLLRGPSVLDRVVAMDTLLSVLTCGVATAAGFALYSVDVSVVVVVALMGFIGSAAVARILLQEREL